MNDLRSDLFIDPFRNDQSIGANLDYFISFIKFYLMFRIRKASPSLLTLVWTQPVVMPKHRLHQTDHMISQRMAQGGYMITNLLVVIQLNRVVEVSHTHRATPSRGPEPTGVLSSLVD